MAYLDFSVATAGQGAGIATAPRPAATPRHDATARFTALEWSVVALARHDSIAKLRETGRLARALGGLFGFGGQSRLADPRLEALRRAAVHGWHNPLGLPQDIRAGFREAGFSTAHLTLLLDGIAAAQLAPATLAPATLADARSMPA